MSIMNEQTLKQLVAEGKASIIYVHGTARSGSTITEVIFSNFADRAIHEVFGFTLHAQGGSNRPNKLPLNADIYEEACGVIVNHILEILKEKDHATILIKELSFFFALPIWERWIQIPDKFIFTIREPHSQYFSMLSLFTYYYFHGDEALVRNRKFVLDNAVNIESAKDLQNVGLDLDESFISDNQKQWEDLIFQVKTVRSFLNGTSKKIAIMDLNILRMNPYYAIEKILEKLGLEVNNLQSGLDNLDIRPKSKILNIGDPNRDLNIQSKSKKFNLQDPNRESIRKARNSKAIDPLVEGECISPYAFPLQSREHIWGLIPIYLDLLYAPEQVAMPSLEQLNNCVAQSETLKLSDAHPFEAYAIANFHLHQKTAQPEKIVPLLEQILNGNTTTSPGGGKESVNSERFKGSFEIVDRYWNQWNQTHYS